MISICKLELDKLDDRVELEAEPQLEAEGGVNGRGVSLPKSRMACLCLVVFLIAPFSSRASCLLGIANVSPPKEVNSRSSGYTYSSVTVADMIILLWRLNGHTLYILVFS